MTRLEENGIVIAEMNKRAKLKPTGTYEEMVTFQLGAIATMLGDISKSLAILADKEKNEEDTATWLDAHDGCMKCSNCGYELNDSYYAGNYCQNCGKKMRYNVEENP